MSVEKKEVTSVATNEAIMKVITDAVCSVSCSSMTPSPARKMDIGLKVQASLRKRLARHMGA